jgi:N-acetylneuraminic acid mutarotase
VQGLAPYRAHTDGPPGRVRAMLAAPLAVAAILLIVLAPDAGAHVAGSTVVHRVNAGGPALSSTPSWEGDTVAAPSPFVNAAATGNEVFSTAATIDTSDPSVPAGTPMAVFQDERFDRPTAPEMTWDFPVTPGRYEVHLYFAETWSGAMSQGARQFDVEIEGAKVLDDYDVFADVGANKGVVKSFTTTSDGTLDVDFLHAVQNPALKAIEVLTVPQATGELGTSASSLDFGNVLVNSTPTKPLTLTNNGGQGDPSIVIQGTSIAGANAGDFSDDFNDAADVTLGPGQSTTITVQFAPTTTGQKSATLEVAHTGNGAPLQVPLSGNAVTSIPVGFGKGALSGESSIAPTSLQWGPDGRLYVANFNGAIKAYDIQRSGPSSYAVTATETIGAIQSITNHDDSGAVNTGVADRLVTGLLVTGSASNPVIYVTSSDPRIGGGANGTDLNLDTNSSMVSRLTKSGGSWQRVDLVRGLPRSEENHASNGMALDSATNTLYVAQGGNTNSGATSNNFALLPEYALSAAILSIDLDAIGNSTYDIPTLDDETRAGSNDPGDPFGGNDGKNQARIVPGGPVQVHAPGFRNPYDVLLARGGRMYTIDNGANAGWGDVPQFEGPGGLCTNAQQEPGVSDPDSLHRVSGAGYYGGHPNPTRGNTANTFNPTNPQSPVNLANPIECDYREKTAANGALTTWPFSVNGIVEYTATNFGGQMDGDLIAADYVLNKVYRVELNAAGTAVTSNTALFSNVGSKPLDVTALGNSGPFPGTIWVADQGNGAIHVFEPADYDQSAPQCTGADDPTLDGDGDGYDNADEIDNGTSPCSSADRPPDRDADLTSDRNDPDDDNDTTPDQSDPFAIDPDNGKTTRLPVSYTWENDAPNPGGLLGLGFTGLMSNGNSNYENQFDPAKMTAGGAAGVTTVDEVSPGDARGAGNDQKYGFQFGVDANPATNGKFTAHTRIQTPFAGMTPQDDQSMGLFIGNGDQDNFVRLVTAANGGAGGIELSKETAGQLTELPPAPVSMPGPGAVDLYLTVDPDAATVQASYTVTTGGSTTPRNGLGDAVSIPTAWLTGSRGLAVGIISTSAGAPTFPATWDFIEVKPDAGTPASTVARDNFTRSVSAGLGTADVGGPWTVLSGPPGDFSVDGTKARIAAPLGAGQRIAHLGSTSVRDLDAGVAITFPQAVQGAGGHFGYLLLRRSAGGAYYRVGLFVDAAGKVRIRAESQTGEDIFPDVDTGLSFAPGDTFRLRVQAEGASPTTLRVKAWEDGTPEPGSWSVTKGDSTVGPQATGSLGLRTVSTAGSTTIAFDELLVTELTATPPPDPVGTWQTRAPSGLARQEVAYVQLDGKMYLAGGATAHQRYDPQTNSWSNLAPLPANIDHIQGVATGGRIYYIGGLQSWPSPHVNTVYVYDPATNTFSQGAPMPAARARGAGGVAVHGGKIYYAGGLHNGTAVKWLDVYDPAANTWTQLPDMPTARDHFHAEVVDGKLYAIGGRNVAIEATTKANEVYDVAANQWSTGLAPLPTARGGFAASKVGDEIVVIGGEGANNQTFNTVEAYDTGSNTWRTLAPMPTARHGIQAASCNGGIYIATGGKVPGSAQKTDIQEVYFLGEPAPCDPPPRSTGVAEDQFNRTVSGGLGTADVGGPWAVLTGPAGDFSVDGSKARIVAPQNAGQRVAHLGSTSVRDLDARVELTFPNAVSGPGSHFGYLLLRRSAGGAYYRVGLFVDAAGTVRIRAEGQTGDDVFPDIDPGLSFTPGDSFNLRVQLEGASPSTMRVKAWEKGTSEPSSWNVTQNDAIVGPQAAGAIGLRALSNAASSTTMGFDGLVVTELTGTASTLSAAAPAIGAFRVPARFDSHETRRFRLRKALRRCRGRPTARALRCRMRALREARRFPSFSWTLSEPADMTIVFERLRGGRVRRAGTLRVRGRARRNGLAFRGRVGRRALPPGRYRVTARARAGRRTSRPARARFELR